MSTPALRSEVAAPPASGLVIHDLTTPAGRVGVAFKRVMVAVRKLRGRQTQRPDEVSYAQCGLLFGLAHGEPRSVRELADQVDLTPATVAQMLEHLDGVGLVRRSRSETDRRVVLSSLSELGSAFVAARHARMDERWRAALAEFSDAELDSAARILERVAEFFDAMPSEGAPSGGLPTGGVPIDDTSSDHAPSDSARPGARAGRPTPDDGAST